MWETWVHLGSEDPLEKGVATHSSILAQESHGQRSLVGYSKWGRKGSDTTEWLSAHADVREGLETLIREWKNMGDGNFGNVVPNSEALNSMLSKMWHYMEKVKSTWYCFLPSSIPISTL